ncbi:type I restriction enzyme HsdR N-terminal domain-containing protein, partial [Bacteroidota bacterium]
KQEVFDIVRKKYVSLTSEEWVRQHIINYLIENKHVPASLLSVEKKLMYNRMTRRTDVVVYDRNANPKMIVECKAPQISIDQDVFDQIVRYNMILKVNYLMVTNGLQHFCCKMQYEKMNYQFIESIPEYTEL